MKSLTADDPPSTGPADAPITIVEFSDFQCPYCKRQHDTLKSLSAEDLKDVRIVFRQYPLPIHPWAREAAEIAGCAALQNDDAFWKLHDYLFDNQASTTPENLRTNATSFLAENAGIDKAQIDRCLGKKLSAGGVTADVDLGNQNGVRATPTLFINGVTYQGAKDGAQLRAILAEIRKSGPDHSKVIADITAIPGSHEQ